MKTNDILSTAARQYETAYAVQYTQRDLLAALRSYGEVIDQHPGTPEAGYSRTQIQGIATRVVPAGELQAAQTELAVRHLRSDVDAAEAARTS